MGFTGGMVDVLMKGPPSQAPVSAVSAASQERIAALAAETSRQAHYVQLIIATKDLPTEVREQIMKDSGLLPKSAATSASTAGRRPLAAANSSSTMEDDAFIASLSAPAVASVSAAGESAAAPDGGAELEATI